MLESEKIKMIYTILSGTNRKDSQTIKVARHYEAQLRANGIEPLFLSLEDLPADFLHNEMYDKRSPEWQEIMEKYLIPAEKIFLIMPEYNGSMPGILKLMIDGSDVQKVFKNKKFSLTGISAGRAGNLRGMEHITGSLLHMGALVLPNRLPLSSIDHEIDAENKLKNTGTLKAIETQIKAFLEF